MADCGLVQARGTTKSRTGSRGGGSAPTELNILSCITAHSTSLLKNAGATDVVARDIIGHESAAVSRNYTHIDVETKRAAIDKMPDVTK